MTYLVCVQAPELEFLLKQRTAHVGRIVQLAGAVVVEYLREDARMTVEEILVEDRVVVGERFGETRQARGRDLLQRRFVRLVADTTHVDDHSVLGVRHRAPDMATYDSASCAGKLSVNNGMHVAVVETKLLTVLWRFSRLDIT